MSSLGGSPLRWCVSVGLLTATAIRQIDQGRDSVTRRIAQAQGARISRAHGLRIERSLRPVVYRYPQGKSHARMLDMSPEDIPNPVMMRSPMMFGASMTPEAVRRRCICTIAQTMHDRQTSMLTPTSTTMAIHD